MKIKRSIKLGNGDDLIVNVTLTNDELTKAYFEKQRLIDIEEIRWCLKNKLADATTLEEGNVYCEMLANEQLLDILAERAREQIDDKDYQLREHSIIYFDVVEEEIESFNTKLGW